MNKTYSLAYYKVNSYICACAGRFWDFGHKNTVKYLGARLDANLIHWQQIQQTVQVTTLLSMFMINVQGPIANKRNLIRGVTNSILWQWEWIDTHKLRQIKKWMASVQRWRVLRTAYSYYTMLELAMVMTVVILIDLMTQNKKYTYVWKECLWMVRGNKS